MTSVSTQARHSTSTEVATRIHARQSFTDADAAAVASWYQTSRGYGAVFASFASGRPVDSGDLLDAVAAEIAGQEEPMDVLTLSHLHTWVAAQIAEHQA